MSCKNVVKSAMEIQKQYSLKSRNTFGVDVTAGFYAQVSTEEELREVLHASTWEKVYVLGDGSNVLFTKDFEGLVIGMAIKGRKILDENDKSVLIKLGAGESWHEFVTWAVEQDYEGAENMALIPGTIGGAVAGNIAAYGQNLSDVLETVSVYDRQEEKLKELLKSECELQYRSSIFKRKAELIITAATFRLRKQFDQLETSYHERKGRYGSLEDELKSGGPPPYTMKDVYHAVTRIRRKKLPDPAEEGTVGSFFINPMVTKEKYEELAAKVPELQSYPVEDLRYTRTDWQTINEKYVKIPAGRLLDELGWRGKWEGDVGVSEKHALCVVTNKKATGIEVQKFIEKMKQSVYEKYGIELQSEVDIV
jgi:UDP-N-acetylmuramate dehydrogenase